MLMAKFPLRHRVQVLKYSETIRNRFGDFEEGFYPPETVSVAGWYTPSTEENSSQVLAGRVIADLSLFAPPGIAGQHDEIIVNGDRYSVLSISDYQHGPWWSPGLDVYELRLVKG